MPKAKQPEQQYMILKATPDIGGIRTAQLMEVDHTVIPAIILTEGVLWAANSPRPELALAEEFGKFPEGWNGRPVVLDHPKVNGEPVPASSPEVLEDNSIGQLFNTTLNDEGKLKTEIWINSDRVAAIGKTAEDTVTRLESGDEVVEVSTGLFTMSELTKGEFNGQEFEAIWRNVVPDHLAILPEGTTGACSIEDGCGAPRENSAFVPVMRAAQLSAAACACTDEEQESIFQRILAVAGGVLGFKDNGSLSDSDLRAAISSAIKADEGESDFFFILATFTGAANKGSVVYESGFDGSLFQRDYSIASSGAIKLGSERIAVRPETKFVPVEVTTNTTHEQENTMNKDELIAALIANEDSQFTEEDKPFLDGLEEAHLIKMQPKEDAPVEPTPSVVEPTPVVEPVAVAPVIKDDEPIPAQTSQEYIDNAPPEMQQVLNEGLKMQRQRRDTLVKGLVANKRCEFPEDELRAKPLAELEMLGRLSNDQTFEAAHLVNSTGLEPEELSHTAPPVLFDLNPKKDAA